MRKEILHSIKQFLKPTPVAKKKLSPIIKNTKVSKKIIDKRDQNETF